MRFMGWLPAANSKGRGWWLDIETIVLGVMFYVVLLFLIGKPLLAWIELGAAVCAICASLTWGLASLCGMPNAAATVIARGTFARMTASRWLRAPFPYARRILVAATVSFLIGCLIAFAAGHIDVHAFRRGQLNWAVYLSSAFVGVGMAGYPLALCVVVARSLAGPVPPAPRIGGLAWLIRPKNERALNLGAAGFVLLSGLLTAIAVAGSFSH